MTDRGFFPSTRNIKGMNPQLDRHLCCCVEMLYEGVAPLHS